MPWCEDCAKYWTPTAMKPDGSCPSCGGDLAEAARQTEERLDEESAPWHFKLLVVALVLYLGWRVVDLFV